MLVLPEDGNKYDRNAMKVMMPDCVNEDMLEWVTRDGDSKREAQKVKHILGKQVGKVPANLCRVFHTLLEKEMTLGPIQCHYGGHVGQSTNPHVHQSFKRAHTRFGVSK